MEHKKFSVFDALAFGFRGTLDHIRIFVLVIATGGTLVLGLSLIAGLFNMELIRDIHIMSPYLQQLRTCFGVACVSVAQPLFMLIGKHAMTTIIAGFILCLIFCSFDLGVKKIGLNIYDKGERDLNVAFSYFNLAPKIMIAWFVYALIVGCGYLLLLIPGIVWSLRFGFFPYVMLEKNTGIIDSLKYSYRITHDHEWDLFVLWVVTKMLLYLGAMIILGFLIMWPVSLLSYVYVYRKLSA